MVRLRIFLMPIFVIAITVAIAGIAFAVHRARSAPIEQRLIGRWRGGALGFRTYTFVAGGALTAGYPGQNNAETGSWRIDPDGLVSFQVGRQPRYRVRPRGNMLILGDAQDIGAIWRRVDDGDALLPSAPGDSVVPAPLFDPAQVTQMRVTESWAGLSAVWPRAVFTLTVAGSMTGRVAYSANPDSSDVETFPITIDAAATTRLLSAMAGMSLDRGPYQALITHTDDYPKRKFELTLASGEVVAFFSESQGEGALPWGATINSVDYSTLDDAAERAWRALDGPLARVEQARISVATGR